MRHSHSRRAYKLMRLRKDGTLGPLFINCRQRVPIGEWLEAERCHRRRGFEFRPGWHAMAKPEAPHLSPRGRVWVEVEIAGYEMYQRPERQGGQWFLADWMRVIRRLDRPR